jgi:PRTRC genetic system ThiF family protein
MKKENVHYAPAYFIEPLHPITITVVGCGGTGSLLIPRLARLDYVLKKMNHPGLQIHAYDGDSVEENNVGRQNFNLNDIGENKALNLIQKINIAYGLDWQAYGNYVAKGDKFTSSNITITCVDNVVFRNTMQENIKAKKNGLYTSPYNKRYYWLDCGNGKNFGQVVLATVEPIEQPEKSQYKCLKELPSIIDIYGPLEKFDTEEVQGIQGCSMAESLAKQDVFINDEVAIQAVKIIQQLIRYFKIDYNGAVINQETCKVLPIKIK